MKNWILWVVFPCLLGASDQRDQAPWPVRLHLVPPATAARYRNLPDPSNGEGSCVQASMAYCGCHHGCPPAETLLRRSRYGEPELGGSWPDRVARYCQQRRIPVANVEGVETQRWIEWGLRTGRSVAITYGYAHMIAAVGMTEDRQTFFLWDNNYPGVVRAVPRATFYREHRSFGGGWCVVILNPYEPIPWVGPPMERWWE